MKDTLTHAQFSVMSDFHRGVNEDDEAHREKTGMPLIESCSRDISLYHAGVSLTRTDFKQANRLGENLLITAEKLAAIASLYGADYPEAALDKAWRQLLCAQHHDSITGTNNEVSFVDLMIEYREACELAANIVNRAAAYLASGVRLTGNGYPVFVFNPHPWQRKDPCLVRLPEGAAAQNHSLFDAAGREYPLQPAGQDAATAVFVPDVPAMGYKMYYLKQTETPGAVSAVENYTIENEYYRIKADPALGGGIVSVYDKKAKREVLKKGPDGPANRIAVLREVPDRMETQHEFYTTGHKMLSSDCRAEVTGEKGANFSRLTVKYAMGTVAAVKQEITLYKGVKRIDFRTVVEDYQDSDDLFTVTFPVDVRGARPVFDDRFAPAVRGESNKKLEFQTHQNAMFSHCQVYAANQWLDYGPTVTLNFGGKGGVNIGMTALIRAETGELKAAAERLLEVLTKKAVPVTVYPDTSRRPYASQLVHFNEDLMNTDTRFVLSVECTPNEYEEKLLAGLKPNQRKRFDEALRQNGVAVVYVKDADNLWNKPIDVLLVKAARADGLRAFIDGLADALKTGRAARVDAIAASPLEKPDDYGVALFNSGNLACSVERGGLLNLMLFHTAEFYGNAGKTTHGAELVPEQKTHVFTYALYPHEGSYREADVYRRAFEFNDALIGATGFEPGTNRPLPESKSFLKTDRNFIVTAFKAAGYPMASMKGRFGGVAERGLTLRGFEPHGAESAARFDFGFDIGGADSVDLLDGGAVPVPSAKNSMTLRAAPHSIETLTLKAPSAGAVIGPAKLGAEHEAVEPAYVRSWEHDLGTMPMGYLAVAAVIGKKVEYIDDTSFRVEVSVANNRPDMRAKGKAFLTLPARWQADSREFPYDVAEGGCEVFPVTVTKPAPDAKGMLRLTFEDEGRLFEDVLEVGCFNPGVEAEIVGKQIVVTVSNNTAAELTGELAVATPVETWALGGHNPFAFADITPRTQKVTAPPDSRTEYIFDIVNRPFDMLPAFYAVAKLMVNGRIHFAYAREKGPLHNIWAHTFFHEIAADGGSIRKLLEM